MPLLFHVSDLHVSRDPAKNQILVERLEAIRNRRGPHDLLLVTGDVTDDGDVEQYAEAARLLEPFRGWLLACPGNHDYGRWGNLYSAEAERHWKEWAAHMGISLQLGRERWRVICLDSCLKTDSPLDFAQGRVGETQLWRLEMALRQAADLGQTVVVALHHDPISQVWVEKLQDAQELFAEAYGHAHFILFGHSHRSFTWTQPRGVGTVLHAENTLRARSTGDRLPVFVVDLETGRVVDG